MLYCYMPSYESSRKSCANQTVFLDPVVGGGRVAGSAMNLPLISCGGRTVVTQRSNSLNQPLQKACCGPARGWTRSGHSRVASSRFRTWSLPLCNTILDSCSSTAMLYTLFLCSHIKYTALLPVQTKTINIRRERRTELTHRNI